MKALKYIWLFTFLAVSISASAQNPPVKSSSEYLAFYLLRNEHLTKDEYLKTIEVFEEGLALLKSKKKSENNQFYLRKIFYTTHRKFLKQYEGYTQLSDLLLKGKYDCLTGTAYYGLLLDALGFEYQIMEFDFHIFLLVQSTDGEVLIEATDPLYGFVTDTNEIKSRIEEARKSTEVSNAYQKTFIQNEISLKDLAGLQYFNLAVKYFNDGEIEKASRLIRQADLLYPSERIKNTHDFIVSSF